MRLRFAGLVLAVGAVLVVSPGMRAQTAPPSGAASAKGVPRTPDGKPDLSGIWNARGRPGDLGYRRFMADDPPLQPEALKLFQYNREGVTDPSESGLDERDPSNFCYPVGATRIYTIPRPVEIRQLPGLTLLLSEWDHTIRRIYTDGREHPDGFPLVWEGHSIGKWDGDTFVVDTTSLRPETWVDAIGTPHSDALHIVERFRLLDRNTLEIDVLFEDSKAYTKPWGGKKVFEWKPDWEILGHANCEDHLQMGKPRASSPY